MKCNQRGCSCCTCEECGRDLSYCICDLIRRTHKYLEKQEYDIPESLLQEWLETT